MTTITKYNFEAYLRIQYLKAMIELINIDDKNCHIEICFLKISDTIVSYIMKNSIRLINKEIVFNESTRSISIQIDNPFYSIKASEQLNSLRLYNVDYSKQIEDAINSDEYVFYDVDKFYLTKAIYEHPKKYYSYILDYANHKLTSLLDEYAAQIKQFLEN